MRYTIAKEQEVKRLAEKGKDLEYISALTGIPRKVIWQWVPELRPHEDIIKQSVKQRYHFIYPDFEAKISAAFSPLVREDISEEEWENVNKIIYDTLFEESIYVFKNVLSDPPNFGDIKKLSNEKFVDYLKHFWDYDNSPYILEHNSDKERISRNYAAICRNTIHYWSSLKNKLLRDITKGDIELIHEKLVSKNLSPSRIYSILKVGLTPLEYAYKNGLTLLKTYEYSLPKKTKKTFCIDSSLLAKIFNDTWEDKEAFLANIIAYYAGLSLEETRYIRLCDLYTDGTLSVNERNIKIPKNVVEAALKYASTSYYKDFLPTDYIFFSPDREKPSSGYKWEKELKNITAKYSDIQINFSLWKKLG